MKLNVKQILFGIIIIIFGLITFIPRHTFHITTDLTSLIRTTEYTTWPTTQLTDRFSSVTNIIIQSESKNTAIHTARAFLSDLHAHGVQTPQNSTFSIREIAQELTAHRGNLLGDDYRDLLQARTPDKITESAITEITQSLRPTLVPLSDDPFLLLTNYLTNIGNMGTNWTPENNMLWQYRAPYYYVMLSLEMPPTTDSTFLATANHISDAARTLSTDGTKIFISGVPMHTATMTKHSKSELGTISVLGIISAILLTYMLFRRFYTLFPVVSCLFIGFVMGITSLFLFFDSPHILSLVFGTTLIGLGIDYTFHTLSSPASHNTTQNIYHSYLTTVLCFLPLLFSSLDLLRQISTFTITGITTIYVAIRTFKPTDIKFSPRPMRIPAPLSMRTRVSLITAILLIIVATLPFTRIENNMSMLYRPSPELLAGDRLMSELNNGASSKFLMVRGPDLQSVLETEETLKQEYNIKFFGVSSIIPSIKRQNENRELIRTLYTTQSNKIRKELGLRHPPRFIETPPLTIDNIQSEFLKSWLAKLVLEFNGQIYSISQIPSDTQIQHENARIISPANDLTHQISQYSHEANQLLMICAITLFILLSVLYGRRAIFYLIPSVLGLGLTVAILTIFGQPITFFHLLSLFIVIGLGMDYTIFHINSNSAHEVRPVFFSFLTSFIGFGLLSFTTFFLIRSMGITLGLGLLTSYLISFFLFRGNGHN